MLVPMQRILIVDDQQADLMIIKRSFDNVVPHMEVETCSSSSDAVERITSGDTDIVLLDINMPGLTGLEVLSQSRSRRPNSFPTVIVLTTSENPEDLKQAYEHGASAYVVTPDSMEGFEMLARSIVNFWGTMAARPN